MTSTNFSLSNKLDYNFDLSAKFRYPNITAGYLGFKYENATLNSAFYAEILNNNKFNNAIVFPQRVLTHDFFCEIMTLESAETINQLGSVRTHLAREAHASLLTLKDHQGHHRTFINLLNLLLRYGLFQEIINIQLGEIHKYFNDSDLLEINLIKEIALHRSREIFNTTIQLDSLKIIAHNVLSNNNLTDRIQILTLNYLVVISYRFGIGVDYQILKKCYEKLLSLIDKNINTDFGDTIRASVAYRGLAMIKEIDNTQKNNFLNKAEFLARNIHTNGKLENLIAKENLYTCLQTQSKWNTLIGEHHLAKENLIEMTHIDPWDSTGYGELGFFLLNKEQC